MKTFISLKNEKRSALPAQFQADDVRYTESLVEYFLTEYTKEGDLVLDPFMGFGTTLVVAEAMNRVAYGVEFSKERCDYVRSLLRFPERAILGDSRKLAALEIPDLDFSLTSPPYMRRHDVENPFTAYSSAGEGYQAYLNDIRNIYDQLRVKLKPTAHAVIEVSNLKHEDGVVTTLAWDIANEVSKVLRFVGEIVVAWEGSYGYGYEHSYCLVFKP